MGLFGGGNSSSQIINDNDIITYTPTAAGGGVAVAAGRDVRVEARDFGLTGAHAVELAAVATAGGTRIAELGVELLEDINLRMGAGYQQLLGGAGELIQTVNDRGAAAERQTQAAVAVVQDALRAVEGRTGIQPEVLVLAGVGLVMLFLGRRR